LFKKEIKFRILKLKKRGMGLKPKPMLTWAWFRLRNFNCRKRHSLNNQNVEILSLKHKYNEEWELECKQKL
jgi:hypothetical protein